MPSTALKHLAKRAKVKPARAEHLWDKAKDIVTKEYGADHDSFYALAMGITKKMLGLSEEFGNSGMDNLLSKLMMARDCAHVHHWQVKSLSLHLALGELYELITDFMDELAEMYMGMSGVTVNPDQSEPNGFSQQDPVEFIRQFSDLLLNLKHSLPQDDALINKYEELQGAVQKVKYKMENLH